MTTKAIRGNSARPMAAWLLAATLLFTTAPAAAQAKPGSTGRFTVKFQAGSLEFPEEIKLKANVGKEALAFEGPEGGKKKVAFSIPPQAVTGVASRYQLRSSVSEMEEFWRNRDELTAWDKILARILIEPGEIADTSAQDLAYMTVVRDYNVTIAWQEESSEHSVVLRVKKRDYDSLLAELEWATGKPWPNVWRQWQKFKRAPPLQREEKIFVRLDRSVRLAHSVLPAGPYQAVLIETSGAEGELYFFEFASINQQGLVAVALVEVANQPGQLAATKEMTPKYHPLASAEVAFQERGGINALSEIRTPAKVIRFKGSTAETSIVNPEN